MYERQQLSSLHVCCVNGSGCGGTEARAVELPLPSLSTRNFRLPHRRKIGNVRRHIALPLPCVKWQHSTCLLRALSQRGPLGPSPHSNHFFSIMAKDEYVYHRRLIIGVTAVILITAVVSYSLRLYARRISRARIWLDDITIGVGLVSSKPQPLQV